MQDKSGEGPGNNGDAADVAQVTPPVPVTKAKSKKPGKEERMAEALRANLRRRKSAAKVRKALETGNE
ncbi:hypothetical protein [Roseibium algae]|uniref:Uncharacterized protein n=1 Tax=Roseibium algae TaxID=3123038 RepID=A0ABU8TGL7_9HYPH